MNFFGSITGRMSAGALLDLVWPRSCEGCGAAPGRTGHSLCWDCLASLPLIQKPFCSLCGDPVEGAITRDYVCSLCVDHRPGFDKARSALQFKGVMKDLLHKFKYERAIHLRHDLAVLLHACVRANYEGESFDAVTFVPLHPAKERARTYNQARLLADDLSRLMEVSVAPGCLVRLRETGTQTRLNMRERARNVAGAFAVPNSGWIEGRSILLVDDVMTTGATVSECSRALKEAGAVAVCVVTVARG